MKSYEDLEMVKDMESLPGKCLCAEEEQLAVSGFL